jgi:hypothetical protein
MPRYQQERLFRRDAETNARDARATGKICRHALMHLHLSHFPFVIPSEVEESLAAMADERKTLEQRAQMTDIERLRHSAAHVLATAICCHPEHSRRISHYFLIS